MTLNTEIVEVCDPRHCVDVEQVFIDFYDSSNRNAGYNICPRAFSKRGCKLSSAQIEKMRKSSTGRRHTDETRNKIGLAHAGRPHDDAAKRKISIANTGRKRTQEAREKASKSMKGRPKSEEHRKKISAALMGKSRPSALMAEMTRKAAEANRGKNQSAEHTINAIEGKRTSEKRRLENGIGRPRRGGMRLLEIDGEFRSMPEWASESGVNYGTLKSRIKDGWPVKDAVWASADKNRKKRKKKCQQAITDVSLSET